MFNNLRVLAKCAAELRRIANALEYFAIADARSRNTMYLVGSKRGGKDKSELLHTDDIGIRAKQEEQWQRFLEGGAQGLDAAEVEDDG